MFGFKNEWKGAWHDTMSGTKMLLDVNASLKNKEKKSNKHWIWITKNVCSYKHNVYR